MTSESFQAGVWSSKPRWIESAPFDLVLFILSPLLGIALVLVAPAGHGLLLLVIGSLLGMPHYLSTYAFYFWDDTRAARRSDWWAYFAAPLGIVIGFTLLMFVGQKGPLMFLLYWWNAFHISRQSCGILSIYRHASGVSSVAAKRASNGLILTANACFALWNIDWNLTVQPYLTRIWEPLPRVLIIATAVLTAAALVNFVMAWRERNAAGQAIQLPELTFLVSSILLFAPYLWVRDWNRASFAVLTGHFVQYLGLVWLVHRRKFRQVSGSTGQRALAWLSSDRRLLVTAMLTIGVGFLAMPRVVVLVPWSDFYGWLSGLIAFLHFYLDGVFWAFKRPEVRQAIGPHLAARPA